MHQTGENFEGAAGPVSKRLHQLDGQVENQPMARAWLAL
jgi:hypothetical protein